MKESIKKYNGEYKITTEDNIFKIAVVLFNVV